MVIKSRTTLQKGGKLGAEIGKISKKYINDGLFVPDEILIEIEKLIGLKKNVQFLSCT